MNTRAIGLLEVEDWIAEAGDETALSRACATQVFRGDLEGEGRLEVLLFHHPDGTASSVGLEHIVGRLGNREGSFVLEHSGSVEDGVTKANFSVVPGSGTHELDGLRGSGWFVRPPGQRGSITLDYHFG
ncbi:DUF3224 domain-containing protein [Hymenobacter busanensis]|uniref:DUF3224 domain-containing protein n=1 Tax=Hymenobacter busanensis TaxID=2607656 RepID=A0A7L5A3Y9_9BACT|nr:DUF3224 domain-containing protein [Hymenobacter busanensis]KAA9338193.1 DUF3224 domain-containing protein [Hymenobacter busanensis]QHJ09382.1 DUF3224 domain-containing protein [Hymenobacter busanensis]